MVTRGHRAMVVMSLAAMAFCVATLRAQPIVVFEAYAPADSQWAGDIDIGARAVTPTGETAWAGEPFRGVATGTYAEQWPVVAPDGAGGLLVFGEATARAGEYAGDWEIIGQRIDAAGNLLWENGESSVVIAATTWSERRPAAIPDGSGGAFVFYEAWAPAGSEWAGDVDIHGQHVSASGELLWGEQSVEVANSGMLEQAPCVISDGAGGAIVLFELMLREGEFAGISNIVGQRVSPDGQLLWAGGEESVLVAVSEWHETDPVAVPDGAGGALVFFQAAAPEDSEYAGDVDVNGQRVSADGRLLWADGQGSIRVHGSGAIEAAPVAVADGAGGAVVVCEAASTAPNQPHDWDVIAQRISGDGELLWGGGALPVMVCDTQLDERVPAAVGDGAGGAFVAFEAIGPEGSDWAGLHDVYVQRMSANGEAMWGGEAAALAVSAGDYVEQSPCIAPDGAGGVIVACEAVAIEGEYAGDWEIVAQRFAPDGTAAWNDGEHPSIISATGWSERFPVMGGGSVGAREREDEPATRTGPADPGGGGNRANPVNP